MLMLKSCKKYCVLHHVDFTRWGYEVYATIETQVGWTFYANNGTSAIRIASFTQPNTKKLDWNIGFYFQCFREEQLLVFICKVISLFTDQGTFDYLPQWDSEKIKSTQIQYDILNNIILNAVYFLLRSSYVRKYIPWYFFRMHQFHFTGSWFCCQRKISLVSYPSIQSIYTYICVVSVCSAERQQ